MRRLRRIEIASSAVIYRSQCKTKTFCRSFCGHCHRTLRTRTDQRSPVDYFRNQHCPNSLKYAPFREGGQEIFRDFARAMSADVVSKDSGIATCDLCAPKLLQLEIVKSSIQRGRLPYCHLISAIRSVFRAPRTQMSPYLNEDVEGRVIFARRVSPHRYSLVFLIAIGSNVIFTSDALGSGRTVSRRESLVRESWWSIQGRTSRRI